MSVSALSQPVAEGSDEQVSSQLHPLRYEGDVYHCPVTGFRLFKDYRRNLKLRKRVVAECEGSEDYQQKLTEACRQSIIVWLNLFGWTYRLRTVDESGKPAKPKHRNQAFITWPCQDTALDELVKAVWEGHDAIIDKSRDMGASWLIVSLATWLWLFYPDTHSILASEKEDKVDKAGDPDTLFFKARFLLRWMPHWMLPDTPETLDRGGKHHQHLQLTNPSTNSTITGAAMTAHIGRGGRRDFVLFDEMAAMPQATEAWQAAADTTDCRIGNSTPIGAGTEYSKQYFNAIQYDYPKLVGLYYYDHPEKGNGRKRVYDDKGWYTNEAGRWFWWTPWLENERRTRRGPQDMAQNILADHVMSGDSFFNTAAVTRHKQDKAKEPVRCELTQDARGEWGFVEVGDQGRWFVWCELDEDGLPKNQNRNFVMFADPAYGNGQANAAVVALDRDSGEQVAEYVDPYTPPQDLSEVMMTAGRYVFKGQVGVAFAGWESPGPGEAMHYDFERGSYPFVYYQRQVGKRTEKRTKTYGWRATRDQKRTLCLELNKAIVRGEVTIRSEPLLMELLDYVHFDNGSIGPSHMQDSTTGAMQAHGDRVIALAGAWMLRREMPKFSPEEPVHKPGSAGDIHKRAIEKRRRMATKPF